MGIGKAAVYKYIPDYFPKDVGAVGGLVGMLGALGGFFLPLMFAAMYEKTKIPQTTFLVLFLLIAVSFAWLHVTVLGLKKQARLEQQGRTESTESVPTAVS
jgi:NNP family nitrate/nitrite transporter-like MFS transporter